MGLSLRGLNLDLTATRGQGVFNYYVVDQASFDALVLTSGKRIGVKRGVTIRGQFDLTGLSGVRIEAYGAGADPLFFGSIEHTSGWSNVSGDVWEKDIGYTALNCFALDGETVSKFDLGTYGALSAGEFGVSGDVLQVNSAIDPNDLTIEVPENGTPATASGIYSTGDNNRVEDLRFWFWGQNGIEIAAGDNFTGLSCDFSYNSNDGGGAHSSPSGILFDACLFRDNGQTRTAAGAAGDGFSFHDTSSGTLRGCTFTGNCKSGVSNQPSTSVVMEFNYFRGNYQEVLVIGSGGVGSTKGEQDIRYNVIIWSPEGQASGLGGVVAQSSLQKPNVRVYNNTLFCDGAAGSGHCGLRVGGGDVIVKNNIIKGFNRGIDFRSTDEANASLVNDYNCLHGNTTAYFNNGTPGVSAGTNDTTSDPLFTDAASLDFTLQTGSPCKNTGTDLSFVRDYAGNGVPFGVAPDMGAYERQAA